MCGCECQDVEAEARKKGCEMCDRDVDETGACNARTQKV